MGGNKKILVSYSHIDRDWLTRLRVFMKPLEISYELDIWDDTAIRPGLNWRDEIDRALDSAAAAILLVSPDFLASEFIRAVELPAIISYASTKKLVIIWILVSHCLYTETPLADIQAVNETTRPLDSLSLHEQNMVLASICVNIKKTMESEIDVSHHEAIVPMSVEIPPDDWDKSESGFFRKLKKLF